VREVGPQQLLSQGQGQPVVQFPHLPEPHLDLRRVNVDVDVAGRNLQEDERHRVPPVRDHLPVRLVHRPEEDPVADVPSVEIEGDPPRAHQRVLGRREVGMEVPLPDLPQRPRHLVALEDRDPIAALRGRQGVTQLPLHLEVEADRGMADREAGHGIDHVARLDLEGAEEPPAHGHVLEEVPDLDQGAGRAGRRADRRGLPVLHHDLRPLPFPRAAHEPYPGDGADGRERFPAEPERRHAEKIVRHDQLARSVRRERQRQVLRQEARPVVGDADELPSPFLDLHAHLGGPGVEGVLDELLHHAGGPLDDLPRRDLVDDLRRKHVDMRHRRHHSTPPRDGQRWPPQVTPGLPPRSSAETSRPRSSTTRTRPES
jgi:hypothetical protein